MHNPKVVGSNLAAPATKKIQGLTSFFGISSFVGGQEALLWDAFLLLDQVNTFPYTYVNKWEDIRR